jgi:RNA polymerase-associated protein RTF1
MLARKNQLQGDKPAGTSTMEKSRLTQARTLALRRQDYAEVDDIDAKLADLAATTSPSKDRHRKDDIADMLAKVNERNRKANHEVVRKAEIMEVERKRRERKLATTGGSSTPHDPSARLKTLPRLFNAATPSSRFVASLSFHLLFIGCSLLTAQYVFVCRPGTPNPGGTPLLQPPHETTRSVSPIPPSRKTIGKSTFEAAVIDTIEVDLGDF